MQLLKAFMGVFFEELTHGETSLFGSRFYCRVVMIIFHSKDTNQFREAFYVGAP